MPALWPVHDYVDRQLLGSSTPQAGGGALVQLMDNSTPRVEQDGWAIAAGNIADNTAAFNVVPVKITPGANHRGSA